MHTNKKILGWREWLALPGIGIDRIKAKIDTGARTSALHAFYLEPYNFNGEEWVRFGVQPEQNNRDLVVECKAPIKDRRIVSISPLTGPRFTTGVRYCPDSMP